MLYLIPIVTTEKSMQFTQKERRTKSEYVNTKKNDVNTKYGHNEENKGLQSIWHSENKELKSQSKSVCPYQ